MRQRYDLHGTLMTLERMTSEPPPKSPLSSKTKSQLNLQSISIQGSNPDFFVVQNGCPRSLAAKKTYTVVVPSTNAMASGNFRILPWPFLTDKYDSRTLSSER